MEPNLDGSPPCLKQPDGLGSNGQFHIRNDMHNIFAIQLPEFASSSEASVRNSFSSLSLVASAVSSIFAVNPASTAVAFMSTAFRPTCNYFALITFSF